VSLSGETSRAPFQAELFACPREGGGSHRLSGFEKEKCEVARAEEREGKKVWRTTGTKGEEIMNRESEDSFRFGPGGKGNKLSRAGELFEKGEKRGGISRYQ